jgi:hypothetical protein
VTDMDIYGDSAELVTVALIGWLCSGRLPD